MGWLRGPHSVISMTTHPANFLRFQLNGPIAPGSLIIVSIGATPDDPGLSIADDAPGGGNIYSQVFRRPWSGGGGSLTTWFASSVAVPGLLRVTLTVTFASGTLICGFAGVYVSATGFVTDGSCAATGNGAFHDAGPVNNANKNDLVWGSDFAGAHPGALAPQSPLSGGSSITVNTVNIFAWADSLVNPVGADIQFQASAFVDWSVIGSAYQAVPLPVTGAGRVFLGDSVSPLPARRIYEREVITPSRRVRHQGYDRWSF